MNTTVLNIERSAPTSGERTFSIINQGGDGARKLCVAAYCRVSTDSEEQLNSYKSQIDYYGGIIDENPNWRNAASPAVLELFVPLTRACRQFRPSGAKNSTE